ncbi:MAG: hypothetical protein AAFV93_15220 [Chloroflexota bacterium]
MQEQSQQEMQYQWALTRFYALLATVVLALIIALISFFNLPGLQDPETGRLPELASRALMFLPVIILVGSVIIVVIFNRRG